MKRIQQIHLSDTQCLILSSLLTAMGIVLPMICQASGTTVPGRILLPMFFTVMTATLILPTKYALMTAVMTPILNNLIKGLPPVPLLYFITAELFVFSITALTAKKWLGIKLTILVSFIVCRVFYIGELLFAVHLLGVNISEKLFYTLLTAVPVSIPGMIFQVFVIPLIYARIVKVIRSDNGIM